MTSVIWTDLRVEPRTGVSALPYEVLTTHNLTAKDDVNNVGAGRAAKGASPATSTKSDKVEPYYSNFG